jgi:hypothetical protein
MPASSCAGVSQGRLLFADETAPASLVARALATARQEGPPARREILDHWTSDHGTEIVLAAQSAPA